MVQRKARLDEMDRQIEAQVSSIRDSLRNQYQIALNRENDLKRRVSGLTSAVLSERGRSIQYNILERELDTSRTLYDGLLQRYKEIGVAGGVGTNNVSVVDTALPGYRVKPEPRRNLTLGLLFGAAVGVGLALLREFMDDTIKVPEDIQEKLGLPVLGGIPSLPAGVSTKVALADPRSALSEAYYSVRTALQFSAAEGLPKSLLITSARPTEGKTTTALALARNFARLGGSVLLIDCDLRNPSLHRELGEERATGLTNYLVGASELAPLLQPIEDHLTFLPAGPLAPNPAELLSGKMIKALLEETTAQFDLVLFDGPPVLGLADAPQLASQIGGTVLVIEAGKTRRSLANAALRRLRGAHAHMLGGLLTKFSAKHAGYGYGYGYQYAYDYGTRPDKIVGPLSKA
jgi:capsular exopolysaccharide synthesis family protein